MKLTECVNLVGSGKNGFSLTDEYEGHIFLNDAGDDLALMDSGFWRRR